MFSRRCRRRCLELVGTLHARIPRSELGEKGGFSQRSLKLRHLFCPYVCSWILYWKTFLLPWDPLPLRRPSSRKINKGDATNAFFTGWPSPRFASSFIGLPSSLAITSSHKPCWRVAGEMPERLQFLSNWLWYTNKSWSRSSHHYYTTWQI